jgi:hypothetical protein
MHSKYLAIMIYFIKDFHVGVLFETCQSGHVKPVLARFPTEIVSFILDLSERNSAEPCKFKNDFIAGVIHTFVNVGFFANSNFADDFDHCSSFEEDTQSQEIVA